MVENLLKHICDVLNGIVAQIIVWLLQTTSQSCREFGKHLSNLTAHFFQRIHCTCAEPFGQRHFRNSWLHGCFGKQQESIKAYSQQ